MPGYLLDRDGFITAYNAGAVEVWGRRPALHQDQWTGSHRVYTLDGEAFTRDDMPVVRLVQDRAPVRNIGAILERADGTRTRIHASPRPLHDAAGRMIGALNLIMETPETRPDDAAARQTDDIVSITRRIVAFTNEMNKFLTATANLHHLIRRANSRTSAIAAVEIGEQAATRVARLVSELRAFVRIRCPQAARRDSAAIIDHIVSASGSGEM